MRAIDEKQRKKNDMALGAVAKAQRSEEHSFGEGVSHNFAKQASKKKKKKKKVHVDTRARSCSVCFAGVRGHTFISKALLNNN